MGLHPTTCVSEHLQNTMDNISVIIPCYNSAETIQQAIDSVLVQTYSNFEIIVVDDGSKDDSFERVKKIKGPISIIQQQNQGVSAARNTGITYSNNPLVAFLDADDRWLPEKLEQQYQKIIDGYDFVHCPARNFGELGGWTPQYTQVKQLAPEQYLIELFYGNFIVTSSVMTRKKCIEKSGYFNISLTHCEDWDLWIKVAKKFRMTSLESALVEYRVDNIGLSSSSGKIVRAGIEVIKSNHGLLPFAQRATVIKNAIYEMNLNACWRYLREHRRCLALKYALTAIFLKPFNISGWRWVARALKFDQLKSVFNKIK